MRPGPLSGDEQHDLRERFREHWIEGVAFNKACGIGVQRWDPAGVELYLPYREDLSAHPGVFHGGVLAALIDTAGCGAVLAGHNFDLGSRITTVTMSVQYFSADPGHDAIAYATCTRRGRSINYADVTVLSDAGKPIAQGLVTTNVAGRRSGLDG